MGTQFLIDTNTSIEFLSDILPISGTEWLQNVVDNRLHYMSVINYIELYSYNGTAEEMQTLSDFIAATVILPLNDDIVTKTIEIRRKTKIKLPDAMLLSPLLL